MSRLMFSALLLTSCAAEVPPRADAGDPRVMPVGAVAALDGSFSEGDGLSYAWSVEPEGATLLDAESPFATLIAEAPGFYTLRLEVCDESGRCDTAETWARVDPPSNANKVSDWGLGEFASAESGAGAPVDPFKGDKAWCAKCFKAAGQDSDDWWDLCKALPDDAEPYDFKKCKSLQNQSEEEKKGWCRNNGCRG
jgi:hypothetical protein